MSIHLIIQARMNSSRLPGKVLKTVLGKTLLEYQIERLTRVTKADKIIIATTINPIDDAIVNLCDRLHIPTYRGSEADVLSRYAGAAQQFDSQTIVRITSDCPLIDPELIDQAIEFYQNNHFDYISTDESVYPRGMDVEIFSRKMLELAHLNAQNLDEREHVTPYFYQNPDRFSIATYSEKTQAANERLTVDTPEDFQLIQILLEALYPKNPKFKLEDILRCLTEYPEWNKINQHVQQKNFRSVCDE